MKKEFKEVLSELGIESNQRIYEPSKEVRVQIPTDYDHILFLGVSYIIFKNKISALYKDFETYQDSERIRNVAERLNMNTPGQVTIGAWFIDYRINPALFTTEDNRKLLFSYMKGVGKVIHDAPLYYNDIIVVSPYDGTSYVPIHHPEHRRKRGLLNQRFGWSAVDQYNYQYAKYDKDRNLQPI